ncbi:YqjF family protein [Deminuibacter soli]|uniref:DUF2071 domain-containing protein n=1 Tax=Deminuibacter soli TaxID=2291815 RepID=A0A3E1NPI7_9BACT|nr:DUF2071 domain-containing protein [Deminuibacter soli]RFM29842.1 DUF2071 domain-containing protein [Deminuibacter soli]
MHKVFLTARWTHLAMLNYAVDAQILQPWLPAYTELDTFNGKVLVSLVGFNFMDTRMLGVRWPFHASFPEVNLRFYVKHFNGKEWKRGVCFVSEIVPRPAIAYTANILYREPYKAMPMRATLNETAGAVKAAYAWKFKGKWQSLLVEAGNTLQDILPGSEEEFIFEHYWGYNKYNANTTIEYEVEHVRWQTFPVHNWQLDVDVAALYGKDFVPYFQQQPSSVLLAHGSAVTVRKPLFIKKIPACV